MQEEDEILTALQRLEEMHVSVETLKVYYLPVSNGLALAYLRRRFWFLQGYCFEMPFNKGGFVYLFAMIILEVCPVWCFPDLCGRIGNCRPLK